MAELAELGQAQGLWPLDRCNMSIPRHLNGVRNIAETAEPAVGKYDRRADDVDGERAMVDDLAERIRTRDENERIGSHLQGGILRAHELGIDVIGAEPAGADDAFRSKAAGELLPQTSPNTIADGLLTGMGSLTWPIIRDLVSRIITADDEATISAMRFFWERTKSIIEPSSAVAVAVAFSDEVLASGRWRRIGVILSGGNADLNHLPWTSR